MSSPAIIKSPNTIPRQKLPLHHRHTRSADCCTPRRKPNARFGEVCGGTTADVAAVCCCCPCGLANLVVLAVYKVPAGLCGRALRHKRLRKLQKKGLRQPKCHSVDFGDDDAFFHLEDVEETEETRKAALELENEMWQKFHGAGFWRSQSQISELDSRVSFSTSLNHKYI